MGALQRRLQVLQENRAWGLDTGAARFALRPVAARGGRPALHLVPPPWTPPAELLAAPPAEDVAPVLARAAGVSITSYTRLTAAGAWPGAIEPAELKADVDAASAPVSEHLLPGGAASGIFLHEALELVDLAPLAAAGGLEAWRERPEVDRLFRDLAARHGIAARHLGHAQELVHDALALPVAFGDLVLPAIAGCARVGREVEFLYPTPGGRVHATGVIDLICEHQGRVYLVDWKSDLLDDYGAAAIARHVNAQYQLQARLYALALIKMLGAGADDRFGGVAYLFLRGRSAATDPAAAVHFERPAPATLRAFAHDLEKLA
jgi:exodeoxyribonuclease V beta subunit